MLINMILAKWFIAMNTSSHSPIHHFTIRLITNFVINHFFTNLFEDKYSVDTVFPFLVNETIY
jgi:hypothetical protein